MKDGIVLSVGYDLGSMSRAEYENRTPLIVSEKPIKESERQFFAVSGKWLEKSGDELDD